MLFINGFRNDAHDTTHGNRKQLGRRFLIVMCLIVHKLRSMHFMLTTLLLAMLVIGNGCFTAGGKSVGLLSALNGQKHPPLTAEQITKQLRLAEKKRGEQSANGVIFEFERDVVIEDFDGKGDLTRRQTRRFQSFTDHRIPVLLMHDGKEPTPEQIEKEHREIKKNQIKFLGNGNSSETDVENDANLILRQIEQYGDRFTPRLIGEETINGRPAYIMQYLFDATKRFDDPLVNLVLKHLLIKVWVDREEFHIAKIDAELANPLYALGGLAAKLNSFKLTAYQKRLTPNFWVDSKVNARIHGRVLWETKSIHFRSESTDFKLLK